MSSIYSSDTFVIFLGAVDTAAEDGFLPIASSWFISSYSSSSKVYLLKLDKSETSFC